MKLTKLLFVVSLLCLTLVGAVSATDDYPPDFIIPETPWGTLGAIVSLVAAFLLASKYDIIKAKLT